MPTGLLIGGASLLSGGLGYLGATKAASLQAQSASNALGLQQSLFNQGLSAEQPFINLGTGASNQLADIYGIPYSNAQGTSAGGSAVASNALQNFTQTPDYQFAFSQGMRGVNAASAAAGMAQGGSNIKNATTFGQGLATQQFGNYFNRLLSLTQLGAQGAGNVLSGSNIAGANMGQTTQNIGAAQASGVVGGTNAITGGIQSGVQNYLLAAALNKNGTLGGNTNVSSYQAQPQFGSGQQVSNVGAG